MLLEYLNTFIHVAELGCYSKTARRLHLTEGSVSHHVAAVENLFGSRLLVRSRNGSRLTDEGKIALEAARQVFSVLERARGEILDSQRIPHGTVKVEASTIPGEHVLPGIVSVFLKQHPQLDFVVQVSDSRTAFEKLRAGESDIAAVGTLHDGRLGLDLERIPLATERLVVIAPRNHPLAKRATVNLVEVKDHPFVNRTEGSGTRIEMERLLQNVGVSPADLKIKLELGSTEAVINAVSQGAGISIVSEIAARKAEKASLVKVLQIGAQRATRRFYLTRIRKRPPSKAAALFWEFCRTRKIRALSPASSDFEA